jgi:hypothetical protein
MTSIKDKREYLTSLYPGYSWHEKVAGMSQEQVIAVYLRFKRDGPPKREPKLSESPLSPEEDPKPEQDKQDLRLF